MRFFVKCMIKVVVYFVMLIVIGVVLNSTIENIQAYKMISDFKSKGVYQDDLSDEYTKYYKVNLNLNRPGYEMHNKTMLPGNKGDIICTGQSNLPIIGSIASFLVGGHASIVVDSYSDYKDDADITSSIEVTGIDYNKVQLFDRTFWSNDSYYNSCMVLRATNSESKIDEMLSNVTGTIGDDYNYSFTFNTNKKSYCTDLVSKAYASVGINLNKDSFWTTVWDLVVSNKTYLVYYSYYKNDIHYIYYAE